MQIKTLTDDEIKSLLSECNPRYKSGVKNRAILLTLLHCGLRVSELCDLKLTNIDLERGKLEVVDGKGGKDRRVPIPQVTIEAISQWHSRREAESEYLFCTRTGNRTYPQSIRRTINRYAERAGIKKSVSPHTFRHTFATRFLRRTNNLYALKDILGHENISTTEEYLHFVEADIAGAFAEYEASLTQ